MRKIAYRQFTDDRRETMIDDLGHVLGINIASIRGLAART